MFHRSSKILTFEGPGDVSRTVGEAFGVSKDQIQKLVKHKADVLEEYSGNAAIHRQCIRRKTSKGGGFRMPLPGLYKSADH